MEKSDGKLVKVDVASLDWEAKVGDNVDVFEDGDEIVVTKILSRSERADEIAKDMKMKMVPKWPYILLAVFFGWFGGHKFYAKYWLKGILYLAFFWTFVPFIISLVEAVIAIVFPAQVDGRILV